MKILILISQDVYVRNFIDSGAFDELGDHELFFLSAPLKHATALQRRANYLGAVPISPWRRRLYLELIYLLMFGYRNRSATFRIKARTRFLLRDRVKYSLLGAPGLRALTQAAITWLIGESQPVQAALDTAQPELVIAPSSVTDPLPMDAVRACKRRGIPTLFLMNGWDNLSSKLIFPDNPDYLGVWGEQSVEHACRIHRMDRRRVFTLGSPIFDRYVRIDRQATPSPYPFRYALFAGCAIPFDEISALRILEETMEARGVTDFKIVYRPHPWRQRRNGVDVFEPERYRHLLIDEQVREAYFHMVRTQDHFAAKAFLPSLDYYPALLQHAEFVICPLSTMMLESAVCETPVLVIAYDDHVHPLSPAQAIHEEHFKGIDRIDGFRLCRDLRKLADDFWSMAERVRRWTATDAMGIGAASLREQVRRYLYFDERSYAQRLRDVVEDLAELHGRARPHPSLIESARR